MECGEVSQVTLREKGVSFIGSTSRKGGEVSQVTVWENGFSFGGNALGKG